MSPAEVESRIFAFEGSGTPVRSVRLTKAADMATSPCVAWIERAIAPHRDALRDAPPLSTALRMALATRRPRRPPAKPARAA